MFLWIPSIAGFVEYFKCPWEWLPAPNFLEICPWKHENEVDSPDMWLHTEQLESYVLHWIFFFNSLILFLFHFAFL